MSSFRTTAAQLFKFIEFQGTSLFLLEGKPGQFGPFTKRMDAFWMQDDDQYALMNGTLKIWRVVDESKHPKKPRTSPRAKRKMMSEIPTRSQSLTLRPAKA